MPAAGGMRVSSWRNLHLSYPYSFTWKGHVYMVPESGQAGAVRLYRAERFPRSWVFVGTLVQG
jgi:hypothetical protein